MKEIRNPTVIIPYKGPSCTSEKCVDRVIYLRPETNGVRVESILFRVVRNNEEYKKNIEICYLANLPGDFIIANRIVEKHYSVRMYFAVGGKSVFTPYMKMRFSEFFKVPFEEADIIGSFEALERLKIGYDELFNLWVPEEDVLIVDGQIIKRIGTIYIVNYDIPAILHKNNNKTDIAVMIFRSTLGNDLFKLLIKELADEFIKEKILNPRKPLSRIFHYSKGPYEQILDGMGYIYMPDSRHIPFKDISFYRYMVKRGVDSVLIEGIINHPIIQIKNKHEKILEDSIFNYTANMDYEKAYNVLDSIVAQAINVPLNY